MKKNLKTFPKTAGIELLII